MSETLLNGNPEPAPNGIQQNQVVTGNEPQNTPPPAKFDFKTMLGDAGEFSDNWREALPESIRNERCLDNIKNFGALANSYVHAQKAIGANKVALPNENSSDEDWAAFFKACGRPDAETGYTTDGVKLPEGITLDEERVNEFRKFAFANGLNQKTFNAALAFDIERVQRQSAAAEAAAQAEYNDTLARLKSDEASGDLRKQFGNDFATVQAVVTQCNKAMQTFGLTNVAAKAGLLNNYDFIRAMAGIGAKMSESRMKGNDAPPLTNDPDTRMNEITGNPDDPFYKKDHPMHEARVREVAAIIALKSQNK